MKKHIKEIIPAIIVAFVVSFMLYIYEPIITYSANIDDFWFDLKLMLPNILLYSLILFLIISLLYIITYILSYIITKKSTFFRAILVVSFIGYLYIYLQGNYLVGSLPALDGTAINWNSYVKENIISVVALVLLITIEIVLCIKIKLEKTVKYNKYVCLATFIMLLTSLLTVLIKPGMFNEKTISTATYNNIETFSSDKNFIIFLVDAVSSRGLRESLNDNPEYKNMFQDFTYFKDAAGGYALTKDSIPFILTGKWSKNEKEFSEYYNEAFDETELFKNLEKNDYKMDLYEEELFLNRRNAKRFESVVVDNDRIDKVNLFKQLTKYILFKYLPYPLKQYSRIETADFKLCKINTDESASYYNWSDDILYDVFKNEELTINDNKFFKFYHLEGAHVPFDLDENLNRLPEDEGTYEMKVTASMKVIYEFINSLKQNGVYDNSVIVILADHGIGRTRERANPILYIKGFNEHHEMVTSEIPVSFEDLPEAYKELLEEKQSTELFSNIDENRTRTYIENFFKEEDHMVEYVIKGKAWESDKIEPTGVEYNR